MKVITGQGGSRINGRSPRLAPPMIPQYPQQAVGPAPWTPALRNPKVWWKADAGTKVSLAGASVGGSPIPSLSSSSTAFNTGATQDFGFALWFKPTSFAANNGIVCKYGAAQYEWLLYTDSLGNLSFTAYNLAGSLVASAIWPVPLALNTWYFVLGTRDHTAGLIKISVNNGAFTTDATALPAAAGTGPFQLFAASPDYACRGNIVEAGYWNRVLTAGSGSDGSALFNAGVPVPFAALAAGQLAGLVAYYDLFTVPALTADATGNGHTLTNTASPHAVTLGSGVVVANSVNNGLVSQWLDNGTFGNNASFLQNSPPTLKLGQQNGLPMLQWDGASTFLICDALAAAMVNGNNNPCSLYFVIKGLVPGSTQQQIFLFDEIPIVGTPESVFEGLYDGTGTAFWRSQKQGEGGVPADVAGGVAGSGATLLAFVFDGVNTNIFVRGISVASGNQSAAGTNISTAFTLGSHRNPTSTTGLVFTGLVGEVIGYSPNLGPADDAACNAYLISRWGV